MVVAGILALALALPTGALFGIGYGTGVRIGYEQIYPLLFPANAKGERNTTSTVENVKSINQIYNAIGGKEASQMGIATGLASAMGELDKNPDFQDLLKLESSLSGPTSSNSQVRTRFGLDNISQSGEQFSKVNLENELKEAQILAEAKAESQRILDRASQQKLSEQSARNKQIQIAHDKNLAKLATQKATLTSQQSSGQRAIITGTVDRKVITFTYAYKTIGKQVSFNARGQQSNLTTTIMKKQTYVGNAQFMRRKLLQIKNSLKQLRSNNTIGRKNIQSQYTALLQASIKAFGATPFKGV